MTVEVPAEGADVGELELPSAPEQGAPNIAVVTGEFDRMQDVLADLGIDSGSISLYDGTDSEDALPDFSALFADADEDGQADLNAYDIIFINCGVGGSLEENREGGFGETTGLDDSGKAALRSYVEGGGKLYVTDLSYDYVEQAFPEFVDFYGSDATPAAEAEAQGEAQTGANGVTSDVTILDETLKAWLGGQSCAEGNCLNEDGTATIEGFEFDWTVINGAHPAKASAVTFWTEGPVSWYADVGRGSGVKPLSFTFKAGAGRVLFSSYHTEETSEPGFTPQERILQYLVFEL